MGSHSDYVPEMKHLPQHMVRVVDWQVDPSGRSSVPQLPWLIQAQAIAVYSVLGAALIWLGYISRFPVMVLFYGLFTPIAWQFHRRRQRRLADEMMSDLIEGEAEQFLVEMCLTVGGVTYGSDHGVVTFVDGWLYYEGRQCVFSLKPKDLESSTEMRRSLSGNQVTTWELRQYALSERIEVGFRDIQGAAEPPSVKSLGRFEQRFRAWRIMGYGKGASAYPPLKVHPLVWHRIKRKVQAAAGVAILALPFVAVSWLSSLSSPFGPSALILGFACLVIAIVVSVEALNQRAVLKRFEAEVEELEVIENRSSPGVPLPPTAQF